MALIDDYDDYINDAGDINTSGECKGGIQGSIFLAKYRKSLYCGNSLVFSREFPGSGDLNYRYDNVTYVDSMGNEYAGLDLEAIGSSWRSNVRIEEFIGGDEGMSCPSPILMQRIRYIFVARCDFTTCMFPNGITRDGQFFSFGEIYYEHGNFFGGGLLVTRSLSEMASILEAEIIPPTLSLYSMYSSMGVCELSFNDWLVSKPPPPPEVIPGIKRKPKPRKDCDMCGCDCATIADINEAYFKKHVDLLNQQNKYINERLNLVTDFTRQQIIAASPTDIDYKPIFDKIDDGVVRIWNGLRPLQ